MDFHRFPLDPCLLAKDRSKKQEKSQKFRFDITKKEKKVILY